MAIYDSSVVIKCVEYLEGSPKGDEQACNIIFSDTNCIIPPTTFKEIDWKKRLSAKRILEHCTIYTYDDPPFSNPSIQADIAAFVTEINTNWLYRTPGGKNEEARLKREFNREVWRGKKVGYKPRCHGSGNLKSKLNDFRILKEANVLAEHGIDNVLVSADWSHTDKICQLAYEKIMEEYLPDRYGDDYREEFAVKVCFYGDESCLSSSGS